MRVWLEVVCLKANIVRYGGGLHAWFVVFPVNCHHRLAILLLVLCALPGNMYAQLCGTDPTGNVIEYRPKIVKWLLNIVVRSILYKVC